jgi:hypothetical protein
LGALVDFSGCAGVSRTQLIQCQTDNQTLTAQCRAQSAEVENFKVRNRNTEDRLICAEQELALLDYQAGLNRQQLVNCQANA